MKKLALLTIVLAALSFNASASSFDDMVETSKASKTKKSKMAEDMTTMDKFTKGKSKSKSKA